jgi:hypothetical protein
MGTVDDQDAQSPYHNARKNIYVFPHHVKTVKVRWSRGGLCVCREIFCYFDHESDGLLWNDHHTLGFSKMTMNPLFHTLEWPNLSFRIFVNFSPRERTKLPLTPIHSFPRRSRRKKSISHLLSLSRPRSRSIPLTVAWVIFWHMTVVLQFFFVVCYWGLPNRTRGTLVFSRS